jgi:hypothetical protein
MTHSSLFSTAGDPFLLIAKAVDNIKRVTRPLRDIFQEWCTGNHDVIILFGHSRLNPLLALIGQPPYRQSLLGQGTGTELEAPSPRSWYSPGHGVDLSSGLPW